MKSSVWIALFAASQLLFHPLPSISAAKQSRETKAKPARADISIPSGPSVTIIGQAAGPTPFISQIHVSVSPANALKSVQFTITPKASSVTRPISATYTSNYLQARAYLNTATGDAFIPVFGLYYNYSNTVVLKFVFTDGSSQQNSINVATADWTDSCGVYKNPTVLQ